MTDEKVVEVGAKAIEAECDTFSAPVRYYVRGEAQTRWERDNPGKDAIIDSSPRTDWNAESWKIIMRAALAALEKEGYAVVPRKPTEVMRDAGARWTEYQPEDDEGNAPDADRLCAQRVYGAMLAALSDPPKE